MDYERAKQILGQESNHEKHDFQLSHSGICKGMAWTQYGGKILLVETATSKGKGNIHITGQLGDVMKESVQTAIGWIKTNLNNISIYSDSFSTIAFNQIDIHIHFPAASIPKDGPSAGVTITTALVSLFSNKKVKSHISMTGEISLKGSVLPVGGIKEKCLAAYEQNITEIILPDQNQQDIIDIPKEIRAKIQYIEFKQIPLREKHFSGS